MGFAFGGSSIKNDKTIKKIVNKKKEEEKKNKEEKRNKKLGLKKGKTYTKAQLRFKEREAKGLSGLTGGKKGETINEYYARQKKSVQDAAKERNKKFKEAKKEKLKVKKEKPLTKFQKRRLARTGRY